MKKFIVLIVLISVIYPRRDCLQDVKKDALGRSSSRPTLQDSTLSISRHFYIHYDTLDTDEDPGYPPDLTDIDGNGIPDYIDEVGIMADSARHVLVDIMGYDPEPFDSDSIYDIYVVFYGPGSYGHCVHDEGDNSSYVKIDNDYTGNNSTFGQTPLKIMQLSLVHEYFHAIQYGYQGNPYPSSLPSESDAYFFEMTSMWIEDVIVPDGNDYLEDMWVDLLLDNPQGEFDNRWPQCSPTVCDGEGYELALFGHYLSNYVDLELSLDETQSTIMKKIWKEYGDSYNDDNDYDKPLVVIDRVLQSEYQISFIEAWVDFISRNLYNGIYENMENPFYYYVDQALIDPIQTYTQTLEDTDTLILSLDNKSVAIQSYQVDEFGVLGFNHSSDEYLSRFSIVSMSDSDSIFWIEDMSLLEIPSNSEIHFVFGRENQGSVTIDIAYNSSCSIVEGGSVWPGNTNADNIVDVYDILPIGIYWNESTCDREIGVENPYKWEAQPLFYNDCISHADANGDGYVDITDLLPIMINFDSTSAVSSGMDNSCSDIASSPRYYSNYRSIYYSLTGNSNAEIQIRHKLEELLGMSSVPTIYKIHQNYPNPFNPSTSIPYYLSEQSEVVLAVFDLMGRQVIQEGVYIVQEGLHEIMISGHNLSSGVYYYQFTINGTDFMPKKMVLLK